MRENEQTVNEQQGRLKERGIVFKKSRNRRDGKQAFSLTGMQWFLQKVSKMLSMCSIIDKVSDVHLTKDCTHFAQMHVFLIQLKHKPLVIAHNTSCLIYGTSQGI